MKILLRSKASKLSLVVGAIFGLSNGGVWAADGTVMITGSIVGSTCKVNGGTPDFTVALDKVSDTSLKSAGSVAGRKSFLFNLTGCAASTATDKKKIAVFFERGDTVNSAGRLSLSSGATATNVDVALFKQGAIAPLVIGATDTVDFVDVDTNGAAQIAYDAAYYATAKAGAGTVVTNVKYTLVYP
ncbi:P pilus assembly protein, pilin FimA [Herbaspirillum sp. CF444]|uniref:fimbrial protein n=1 Tax=Herbaspirillum sp. CF444 TaxID=1144319 RepID=UPI00027233B7|nr:fimbrial protein [Herbaspirillum sp. CF444]EJL88736.1 P pilus assembly protein, pilin FimA [Herbaspirillum sp. CF444]